MQFDDVILSRSSVRGTKPDPVSQKLIAEIIGVAMRAPSSMNTQPWNFTVVTGEPLNRIRAPRLTLSNGGAPAPFQPKGFVIDVWFDRHKTMSIQ